MSRGARPAVANLLPARYPASRKRAALAAAVWVLVGIALLLLTRFAAFHVAVFKHADQSIFRGFFDLHRRSHVDAVATFIANLCDPNPYVFFAVVPVVVALVRGRPRVALGVAAIMVGANLTTQLLKPLLAEPRPASELGTVTTVLPASWPSGHATAAMALALAYVLASPARLRPVVAVVGAAFAVAVSYSFLTLGWHYPSDVLGGFLVAGTWTMLVVGVLVVTEGSRPPTVARETTRLSARELLGPPVTALLAALFVAGVIALARPHAVLSYARNHEAFTIGAAGIGVLGLTLVTGVMLAMRR